MLKWLKQLFCEHKFRTFVMMEKTKFYGHGGKVWAVRKCSKCDYMEIDYEVEGIRRRKL